MTIALSIIAQNGIVFAADTEETWGDEYKVAVGKVYIGDVSFPSGIEYGMAITGAGDSGLAHSHGHCSR